MKIPANIIVKGKYTSGNEYLEEKTNKNYQGYYYKLNGSFYAGKVFKEDAPKLIPIEDRNKLLNRGLSTAIFSVVSGITSQTLSSPKVTSLVSPAESNVIASKGVSTRYFSQKVNVRPTIIKEISKETYDSLQGDPLYITTFIGPTQNVDQAEKQMPGLKAFLSV